MKKIFLTLAILLTILFFSSMSKAQTNDEDIVYLKNGGIMHGVIIEQIPNQSVKIKTQDGNVFVYKSDEIEKITKEPKKDSGNNNSNFEIKQKGYMNITEVNFGVAGEMHNGNSSYGIQTINGYLFNPYFSMGVGVGIENYDLSVAFVPFFADFRVNFVNKRVTPFFSGDIGYSYIASSNYTGGLLINPALGLKFFITSKVAFNYSIGYRYQEYSNTNNYNYYPSGYVEPQLYLQSLTFKFGITF